MSVLRPVLFALLVLTGTASAQERLPDGGIATASGDVAQAWYGQPTTRYDHGILGDRVEGGSLVVIDRTGTRHELVLPERYVFEDLTPRLVDLDGDGASEIITIRTDVGAGAAVAVYGLRDGTLVERSATAPIGRSHRWLSIAAIANFTADAGKEIAIVKTPHIGGVLEILSLKGSVLETIRPPQSGYSTHFIGSRDISLARAEDTDSDGFFELALPTQDRRQIVVLGFSPGVQAVARFDTGAVITQPIGSFTAAVTAARRPQ